MEREVPDWSLAEIADLIDGELHGLGEMRIAGPAAAGHGDEQCITFAGDEKHLRVAEASGVGAIIVPQGVTSAKPHIQVADPRSAFGRFLEHVRRELPAPVGVHPTAVVDPRARIDPSASVGAFAVVERDALIGARVRIYPFSYIGESCHLEADVVIYPGVVLYQDVSVGERSIIHSGAVVGADGFGYAWDGQRHVKVPQVGSVTIGPDCEIGANGAIDRAMIGETTIGEGTKIDNLVQVGHNTTLGKHDVIASQTGIAGSCDIGDRVTMAGQVGIGDHVRIADGVVLSAGSSTTVSVDSPGIYKGFPVRPLVTEQRIDALIGRLPEMAKKIKELERRLSELESNS